MNANDPLLDAYICGTGYEYDKGAALRPPLLLRPEITTLAAKL